MTTTLDREVYSISEAGRLLRVPSSTLAYWLQGGERRGVRYLPIIRTEPSERRYVTWAEFIEAGWLRAYRRQQVPMRELRTFIQRLRDELGVPFPLAHEQPLVSGRRLVFEVQQQVGLAPEYRLVDAHGSQLMLTYPGQDFVDRVLWEDGLAVGWRPEGAGSSVTVRPDVRFGRPAVSGVSTAAIYDESDAGADAAEVAEMFEVSVRDVRWALAFENALRAPAS